MSLPGRYYLPSLPTVASLLSLVTTHVPCLEELLLNQLSRYYHSCSNRVGYRHIRYTAVPLLRAVCFPLLDYHFVADHLIISYAFLPQIVVWSILFGVSASNYDLSSPSMGDARTIIGNRYPALKIGASQAHSDSITEFRSSPSVSVLQLPTAV